MPMAAHAVSCVTTSQIPASDRNTYVNAVTALASRVRAGDVAGVRSQTIAAVAAQFDGMASSIKAVSPQLRGSTLTFEAVYYLKATDLTAGQDEAQFFCAPPESSRVVTIVIPQLPPGNYVVALVHATGTPTPQQMTFLLQNDPPESRDWKLGGFFYRPLTLGGQDGVWYWTKARDYANRKEGWNAYFYYQTALFLSTPVNFISSPNLEKLQKEAQSSLPASMPVTGLSANTPMALKGSNGVFNITGMRTSDFSGNLDLVIEYQASNVSDPAATHTQIIDLMKSLLAQYPELRQGFHGLWVYAQAPGQNPYAIELPMDQIH